MQAVRTVLRDLFWVTEAAGVAPEAMQVLVDTNQVTLCCNSWFLSAEQSLLFPKAIEAEPAKPISH